MVPAGDYEVAVVAKGGSGSDFVWTWSTTPGDLYGTCLYSTFVTSGHPATGLPPLTTVPLPPLTLPPITVPPIDLDPSSKRSHRSAADHIPAVDLSADHHGLERACSTSNETRACKPELGCRLRGLPTTWWTSPMTIAPSPGPGRRQAPETYREPVSPPVTSPGPRSTVPRRP